MTFRFVDDLDQPSGNVLDSRLFTDLRVRYALPYGNNLPDIVLGVNNVLDEDPALCDSCGVINMSPVVHDLPGTVGYLRLSVRMP